MSPDILTAQVPYLSTLNVPRSHTAVKHASTTSGTRGAVLVFRNHCLSENSAGQVSLNFRLPPQWLLIPDGPMRRRLSPPYVKHNNLPRNGRPISPLIGYTLSTLEYENRTIFRCLTTRLGLVELPAPVIVHYCHCTVILDKKGGDLILSSLRCLYSEKAESRSHSLSWLCGHSF